MAFFCLYLFFCLAFAHLNTDLLQSLPTVIKQSKNQVLFEFLATLQTTINYYSNGKIKNKIKNNVTKCVQQ